MSYSILDYATMLGDPGRMENYSAVLKRAVTPDSVVLDLGTGAGYFAVLAGLLGARRVYAIEPNPAIEVGRELARENGVSHRIQWHQAQSTDVVLPELVDIVVADLRGVLPQCVGNLPAIMDARTRLLKPGGLLLPQKDRLFFTIASDPQAFKDCVEPWQQLAADQLKLDCYSKALCHGFMSRESKSENLLTSPKLWAEIDYRTATTMDHQNSVEFKIERAGTGHGFYLWFECQVDDDHVYSFGPDTPVVVYGSAFFPFQHPLKLSPGDSITLDLSVRLDSDEYQWTWVTKAIQGATASPSTLKQSTFLNRTDLTPKVLRKKQPASITQLSKRGRITHRILTLMLKGKSNGSIAEALAIEFPAANKSHEHWLAVVGEIALDFGD